MLKKFMKTMKLKNASCVEFNIHRQYFSIFFFVCKLSCSNDEEKARDVIFDVLIKSKILERLDLSDSFLERLGVQKKI